jgi:hypothetical protein
LLNAIISALITKLDHGAELRNRKTDGGLEPIDVP